MPNKVKYTKELLEPLVKQASSVAQVARMLGIPLQGGSHSNLSRRIKKYQLDTSHFTGQGHMKGKHSLSRKTADQILIKYDPVMGREDAYRLRRAMFEIGVKHQCIECGIGPEYNNKLLVLEIDHINNDWSDNRRENLQFICPNCHSQKTASDGSKAKYLKQLKKPVVIRPEPTTGEGVAKQTPVKLDSLQLKLKLFNWKPKKARQSPPGTNWRTLPKIHTHKVKHPTKEELEKLVWEKPILEIARNLGVSDNAVRMWCKRYGINNLPPIRYWPRRRSGWSHEEALAVIEQKDPLVRKLNDEEVIEILALLKEGRLSQREIAKQYDITHPSVSRIFSGHTYKHIPR